MTLVIPELGPSLGRLSDPPLDGVDAGQGIRFDDIRLELVSGLFDLTGAARTFAASGERDAAIASLGKVAWLKLWERAVSAAAQRIVGAANARFRAAAAESRFPSKRLTKLLLTRDDARAITARLGSGGAPFVAALDSIPPSVAEDGEWAAAITAAARRLESAWMLLEESAQREQARWQIEIERVRAWRRPTWLLWLLTLVAFGVATYLGLVLGGYLPVPSALQGLAHWWWGVQ